MIVIRNSIIPSSVGLCFFMGYSIDFSRFSTPTGVGSLSKLNFMRNKLEHEYKTPEIYDLHTYYELVWSVVKILDLYLELLYT